MSEKNMSEKNDKHTPEEQDGSDAHKREGELLNAKNTVIPTYEVLAELTRRQVLADVEAKRRQREENREEGEEDGDSEENTDEGKSGRRRIIKLDELEEYYRRELLDKTNSDDEKK